MRGRFVIVSHPFEIPLKFLPCSPRTIMASIKPITKEDELRRLEQERLGKSASGQSASARYGYERVTPPASESVPMPGSETNAVQPPDAQAVRASDQAFREEARMLRKLQRRNRFSEARVFGEDDDDRDEGSGNLGMRNDRVTIFSYAGPFLAALLKDLLDLSFVLAIPGIGTVISFAVSICIFLLLFFPKRRYRIASNARLTILDAFILMGFVVIEGLAFPFNLLPGSIGAVGMIYLFDKRFVEARSAGRRDRNALRRDMTSVIREAYRDRRNTDKGQVSERAREALNLPKAA